MLLNKGLVEAYIMEQIARIFGLTRNNKLGFTLIELLVVIAIIGLLAGVSIPIFLGQRTKALISECQTNLQTLFVMQEQYYAEYGRYAPGMGTVVDTYHYTEDLQNITNIFPNFRPGPPEDLNFNYYVSTKDKWTSTGVGDGSVFGVICEGKPSTPMAGTNFWLDDKNNIKSAKALSATWE